MDLGTFARVARLTRRDRRLLYKRDPALVGPWGNRIGYVVGTDHRALRVLLLKLPHPQKGRGPWVLADTLLGELEACDMPPQREANQYFEAWEKWPEQRVRDVAWLSALAKQDGRPVTWLAHVEF